MISEGEAIAKDAVGAIEPEIAGYLDDPVRRARLVTLLRRELSTKPRWARALTGLLFAVGGSLVLSRGALLFDGMSAMIGGILVAAGAAELGTL